MSWLHEEVPVKSFLHLVTIWLILWHWPARLRRQLPLTLSRFESIPGSRNYPSSSRSATFPALVPLARVKKLEA